MTHPDPRPLRLDALPPSVATARAWIGQQLREWSPDGVATAQLLVSELITNVVLHARTPFEVGVRLRGRVARVDVVDGNPTMPVVKHYAADAATGRGMVLLAALSNSWGIDALPAGKRVWFEVADTEEPTVAGAVDHGAEVVVVDGPGSAPADPAPTGGEGMVDVRILGLPTAVYAAAEEHNDALMREFTLIASRSPSAGVPGRLVALAAEVSGRFGAATTAIRVQVQEAIDGGRDTVDIAVAVPRAGWHLLLRLAEQLDESDRYCEEGELLTLASPPAVRHFRRWYTEQVAVQVAGGEPVPWPATDRP